MTRECVLSVARPIWFYPGEQPNSILQLWTQDGAGEWELFTVRAFDEYVERFGWPYLESRLLSLALHAWNGS